MTPSAAYSVVHVNSHPPRLVGAWRRHLPAPGYDTWLRTYRLGIAHYTAETTARPAYREMADTILWSEIR